MLSSLPKMGNTIPCTAFASAASTLTLGLLLLLLHCHLMHVAGMTAAVLMQKTLHRVPDAKAVKSLDIVRMHLDVCRVGVWGRLECIVVVWYCQEAVWKEAPSWLFACSYEACLPAIPEMLTRHDTICRGEGQ